MVSKTILGIIILVGGIGLGALYFNSLDFSESDTLGSSEITTPPEDIQLGGLFANEEESNESICESHNFTWFENDIEEFASDLIYSESIMLFDGTCAKTNVIQGVDCNSVINRGQPPCFVPEFPIEPPMEDGFINGVDCNLMINIPYSPCTIKVEQDFQTTVCDNTFGEQTGRCVHPSSLNRQTLTVSEVIDNFIALDNRQLFVTGIYHDFTNAPVPQVACDPNQPINPDGTFDPSYHLSRFNTYLISDEMNPSKSLSINAFSIAFDGDRPKILAPDDPEVESSGGLIELIGLTNIKPNYTEGDLITIYGTLRVTTTSINPCTSATGNSAILSFEHEGELKFDLNSLLSFFSP